MFLIRGHETASHPNPAVVSINISPGGIPKSPVSSVHVTQMGLVGDGHNHEKHKSPLQAVCLEDWELIEELKKEGFPLRCGAIGENLTVHNLRVQNLPVGTVLEFSRGVVLELTKPRNPCYVLDAIDPRLQSAIAGRCGFYARVMKEGKLQVGETIRVVGASQILSQWRLLCSRP